MLKIRHLHKIFVAFQKNVWYNTSEYEKRKNKMFEKYLICFLVSMCP